MKNSKLGKRLQVMLYLLLRDHLTFGQMNEVIKELKNAKEPLFTDLLILRRSDEIIDFLNGNKHYND